MPLKQVIINNEVFVPRIQLAEALDIIAELRADARREAC
jgi:hypothetical protein